MGFHILLPDKIFYRKLLYMRTTLLLLFFITAFFLVSSAQTPNDGIMMPERNWCNMLQYSNSSWDEYWEGPTRRSNANIGTITTQSVMLMTNYGISDRLNVLAGVPYVWTASDVSYLDGQSGVQDLSVWLKYQVLGTPPSPPPARRYCRTCFPTSLANYKAWH